MVATNPCARIVSYVILLVEKRDIAAEHLESRPIARILESGLSAQSLLCRPQCLDNRCAVTQAPIQLAHQKPSRVIADTPETCHHCLRSGHPKSDSHIVGSPRRP